MTSNDSPRQTLSYLRNLFEAHGIQPKSKLGQNFLIDLNLLDILVQTADLGPGDNARLLSSEQLAEAWGISE